MKVTVRNLYSGILQTLEGTPKHLAQELIRHYPWLDRANPEEIGDIVQLVQALNRDQAFSARVLDYRPEPMVKSETKSSPEEDQLVCAMLGHHHAYDRALGAARFLVGGATTTHEAARSALLQADGDVEEAALIAHGLEASEANLKALAAVSSMASASHNSPQSEQEPLEEAKVTPGVPEATQTAAEVQKAFKDQFVMPVKMGGKHSGGSLLARDHETGNVWLLKPGVGKSPAAGANQDPASQARHEAAFYHMAEAWGLDKYIPHTDLILVNGKEYAAIKLLSWRYKTLDTVKNEDPGAPQRLLHGYLRDGILHQWAILDFVLGNVDRNAQNIMVDADDDIRLIDHGTSFSGSQFDPGNDKFSFVPFYLRAWAPSRFSLLNSEEKLKAMPHVDRQTEEGLQRFLDGIYDTDLDRVLLKYGINPAPSKARLNRLKDLATQMPVDDAISDLWVTT